MTRAEVDIAVGWADSEGWNPGLHDADPFYAADPEGFFIGLLDGEPIASISAVKYGNSFGFIGFYIVKEGYRGEGYGYAIWKQAMDYLEGYDIGLDGVVEQIANYQKSGFILDSNNARYEGTAIHSSNTDSRIVPASEIAFNDLLTYDTMMMPAPRPKFLRAWLDMPDSTALVMGEGDSVVGYTVIRQCQIGYKIGPLFAETSDQAEALFKAAQNRVPEDAVIFLDVPGEAQNPAASALVKRYGMTQVFQTARMYRMEKTKTAISLPLDKWWGVTSFELG